MNVGKQQCPDVEVVCKWRTGPAHRPSAQPMPPCGDRVAGQGQGGVRRRDPAGACAVLAHWAPRKGRGSPETSRVAVLACAHTGPWGRVPNTFPRRLTHRQHSDEHLGAVSSAGRAPPASPASLPAPGVPRRPPRPGPGLRAQPGAGGPAVAPPGRRPASSRGLRRGPRGAEPFVGI